MKISTALVLILLTGLTVWAWQQRTTVSRDAITEEQEMVAPEVIRSEEPIPPVEPPTPVEPQKPVEPIPPVEPPTPVEPPEISLSPVDRVRECLRRQAAIVVPHALASVVEVSDERYAEATVTRLEPDGIHVRHPTGLEKIHYEAMPVDWRGHYQIETEVADHYRVVIAEREARARQEQAEAAAAEARRIHEERRAHGARLGQIEAGKAEAEAERERRNQLRAWHNYDRAMVEYRRKRSDYSNRRWDARRRGARLIGSPPREPVPPPFPRPR